MSVTWSIVGKGTFAALNLSSLCRRLINQGNDSVTFEAPAAAMDGTAIIAYGETVVIKRDDVIWFTGRCVTVPREGSPSSERIGYELVGPWWYLEKIIYQQKWNMLNGSDVLEKQYKSRVVLCQDEDGDAITNGAQIGDAIDLAILKGAPIQKGTIDPAVPLPWDERVDASVAEVIVSMLRVSPDCNAYFDYSTATPTLHVLSRASMPAVSKSVTAGAPLNKLAITPRYDLQIPGVVARFEQDDDINGETYERCTVQNAGVTTDFNTLVTTIRLAGSRMTTVSEKIVTETYPTTEAEAKAFLIAHDSYIADLNARAPGDWSLVAGTYGGLDLSARILVSGTIQDWMQPTITSEEELWGVKVEINIKNAGGVVVQKDQAWRTVNVIGTNATTKTYRKVMGFDSGEAIPTGFAAALFAAWNQLQYEGRLTLIEEECPGTIIPGSKFNLTGGLAAWATMSALIQSVSESVDDGTTEVVFGPAKHLGPEDLVTLLTALRNRRTSFSYLAKTTGKTKDAGGGNIALGGKAALKNAAGGPGIPKRTSWRQETGSYTQNITADPADISKTDANVDIKAREVALAASDGSSIKKAQVLCSAPYGDELSASLTVITALRYNETDHQIQIKTMPIRAISTGSESNWTMITGGQATTCP